MSEVFEALNQLISAIGEDEIFKVFEENRKEIEKSQELVEKINEYRQKNYYIQTKLAGKELDNASERLEKEYEELRNDPTVRSYLNAEVSLCRMMKKISESILDMVHLELSAKGE